jgi:hypothetical protein
MPRRRPEKVDRAGVSTASDVAVLVAFLFGHLDDEGQAAGNSKVDGFGNSFSQIAFRRPGSGAADGLRYRACARFFWAKAQRFGANDGDACGCRNPFESVVVVTFAMLGLRVKTVDIAISTPAACASLPSWERRRGALIPLDLVLVTSVASLGSSCTFFIIFDLLCKRLSSSSCIGSTVCALFIKRSESLFREEVLQ